MHKRTFDFRVQYSEFCAATSKNGSGKQGSMRFAGVQKSLNLVQLIHILVTQRANNTARTTSSAGQSVEEESGWIVKERVRGIWQRRNIAD